MISTIIEYLPHMRKALIAGAAVFAGEYGIAQVNGVSVGEWGYIIVTALGAGYAAWQVSNAG
jgi:hypothetical protein